MRLHASIPIFASHVHQHPADRFADAPSLGECIDSVSRETSFLASNEAPSQQDLERSRWKCLESDSVHLVALDGSRVVAWAQIERGDGTSVAHRGDLGMGVLPSHRGCGLGKRMLNECITAAHARGIDRVELEVRTDNRRALELYRDSGFAVESIVKKAMKIDDACHDAFRMSLLSVPMHADFPSGAGADDKRHLFNNESSK